MDGQMRREINTSKQNATSGSQSPSSSGDSPEHHKAAEACPRSSPTHEARVGKALDNSVANKRRQYRTTKAATTYEEFAKVGGKTAADDGRHLMSVAPVIADGPACMSTITGSSGIYGVPDRVLQTSTTTGRVRSVRPLGNDPDEVRRCRNYHIKSIRRGIPDIMTTDVRGRRFHLATRGVHITNLCLCQRNTKRKSGASAWLFSISVAFLCVICPLMSFVADVTFYVMCSDHYNETANVLEQVRGLERSAYISANIIPAQPTLLTLVRHASQRREQHNGPAAHGHRVVQPAPIRGRRESDQPLPEVSLLRESQQIKAPEPFNAARPLYPVNVEYIIPQRLGKFKRSQQPTPSYVTKLEGSDITKSFETTVNPTTAGVVTEQACANASAVREFMKTDEAARRLEAHRHVTIDIFQPVFIIGSFPSFLLCIFARLVVMVTAHNHFLSAYVINIAGMPLQLITGALGVSSAGYHVGEFGFSCWHCALEGDCSSQNPLSWLRDHVNLSLIIATAAKALDGAAGGCILFIVTVRILWREHRNLTFWWYGARVVGTFFALLLCIVFSTLLVITPAVGVFRLEFIERVGNFIGKQEIRSVFMLLLSMGITAWAASLLGILLYLVYKTYLYCRVKEHVAQMELN